MVLLTAPWELLAAAICAYEVKQAPLAVATSAPEEPPSKISADQTEIHSTLNQTTDFGEISDQKNCQMVSEKSAATSLLPYA